MARSHKITSAVLGLLFPPICVHCKELLDFRSEEALCRKCRGQWEDELNNSVCKECFLPAVKCECLPAGASKSLKKLFHAVEYDPTGESAARSVILSAKNKDMKFLSDLISKTLADMLSAHMTGGKNAVITYMPRSREKIRETGVDQAMIAAKELSKRTGIPFARAIIRTGGREQKRLNTEERRENAYGSYMANAGAIPEIKKKTVILCDDVVTTGASMSAGADIIKTMGATSVVGLALGRTYKKPPKE